MAGSEKVARSRFFDRGIKAGLARLRAWWKLSCQMNELHHPIRRIEAPDISVSPQMESLSRFIPFHVSAVKSPYDFDLSKVQLSDPKDAGELAAEIVRLRNHVLDDRAWMTIQLPYKTPHGIKVMPCISGQEILDDYSRVKLYALFKWWTLDADHPVKEAEMAMDRWYGLDFTVMQWLTRELAKYPKLYVRIINAASGESVVFPDYRGPDLKDTIYAQRWLEMRSWGLVKGAKLRFEIKGPYAEVELEELKKVFAHPHMWHS